MRSRIKKTLCARVKRRSRGTDPAIATVILIGVVGVLGFTVAFWIQGIASQYAKFERVEFQSAICLRQTTDGDTYWKIELRLKNPGTATVSFTGVSINDIEVKRFGQDNNMIQGTSTSIAIGEILDIGMSKVYNIYIDDQYPSPAVPYTSGVMVTVRLHSAGGMDYFRALELV